MPKFEPRPMRQLPVLEPRRRALETCVYCPKLCRSACPVSNAEPRETLIPWGKMSTAYFAARGDVPLNESFAAPAWACTGCHACREACDHQNDVAGTLLDARDAFVAEGLGPAAARRVIERFGNGHGDGGDDGRGRWLLVGCMYDRKVPDVASAARRVANRLLGETRLADACCGLPLRLAGDKRGFEAHIEKHWRSKEVVVVDPGCALALRSAGVRVSLLVERVAERVADLDVLPGAPRVRWHDPCQLGRGLGIYDAPRTVLTRVLGGAPGEYAMSRERAECSGAGGLLPLTMPDTSRLIAEKRVRDAEGDEIVTACASSLLRFRKAGARASDVVSWIARALPAASQNVPPNESP